MCIRVVPGVEIALTRPHIQDPWAQANRAPDQTFIQVLLSARSDTVAAPVSGGASGSALAAVINRVVDG